MAQSEQFVLSLGRFFHQGRNLICDTYASNLDCFQSMFVEPGFCCPDSLGHFFAFFDPSFVVALFGIWGKSSRSDLGLCDEAESFRHSTDRF